MAFCRISEYDIDDDEAAETEGELQIITECWVEPQMGSVINSTPERAAMDGTNYMQLATGVCTITIYIRYNCDTNLNISSIYSMKVGVVMMHIALHLQDPTMARHAA